MLKKFIFVFTLFVIFSGFLQHNKFNGTWSTENCNNCINENILIINIAESYSKIYGSVEIINKEKNQKIDSLDITGYVNGEKAYVVLKGNDGKSFNAVLLANETTLQFTKISGSNKLPKVVIFQKLYE
jgi:thiol-disulfide isomerase/thioredoxin